MSTICTHSSSRPLRCALPGILAQMPRTTQPAQRLATCGATGLDATRAPAAFAARTRPKVGNQRCFDCMHLANNNQENPLMRNSLAYESSVEAGRPFAKGAARHQQPTAGEAPAQPRRRIRRPAGALPGVASRISSGAGALVEDASVRHDNRALFNVLHDGRRTTHARAWRAALESTFDVDGFFAWLGSGAAAGQWPSIDSATCNMYIYTDPATREPTWITWEHNASFQLGPDLCIPLDELIGGKSWPLVPYLLNDPVYLARFLKRTAGASATADAHAPLEEQVRAYLEQIAPGVAAQLSAAEFAATVAGVAVYVN